METSRVPDAAWEKVTLDPDGPNVARCEYCSDTVNADHYDALTGMTIVVCRQCGSEWLEHWT